jgi:hypothetical protein
MKPDRPESTFYTTVINGQTVVVERVAPAYAAGQKGVKRPRRKKKKSKPSRCVSLLALLYPELAEEEELPAGDPAWPKKLLRAAKRAEHREPLELLENDDDDHFHLSYNQRGQKKQKDEIKYTRRGWASGWEPHKPK